MKIEQFTKTMFNAPVVVSAMDKATHRALSKLGAFVRTRAMRSIRRRKKTSAPGGPPNSHMGLLRKNIFFGYNSRNQSVIVGPALLNGKRHGLQTVPEVLEEGGKSLTFRKVKGTWKNVPVQVKPRPYMGPAFKEEEPKLPELFRNSFGRL